MKELYRALIKICKDNPDILKKIHEYWITHSDFKLLRPYKLKELHSNSMPLALREICYVPLKRNVIETHFDHIKDCQLHSSCFDFDAISEHIFKLAGYLSDSYWGVAFWTTSNAEQAASFAEILFESVTVDHRRFTFEDLYIDDNDYKKISPILEKQGKIKKDKSGFQYDVGIPFIKKLYKIAKKRALSIDSITDEIIYLIEENRHHESKLFIDSDTGKFRTKKPSRPWIRDQVKFLEKSSKKFTPSISSENMIDAG